MIFTIQSMGTSFSPSMSTTTSTTTHGLIFRLLTFHCRSHAPEGIKLASGNTSRLYSVPTCVKGWMSGRVCYWGMIYKHYTNEVKINKFHAQFWSHQSPSADPVLSATVHRQCPSTYTRKSRLKWWPRERVMEFRNQVPAKRGLGCDVTSDRSMEGGVYLVVHSTQESSSPVTPTERDWFDQGMWVREMSSSSLSWLPSPVPTSTTCAGNSISFVVGVWIPGVVAVSLHRSCMVISSDWLDVVATSRVIKSTGMRIPGSYCRNIHVDDQATSCRDYYIYDPQ